MSKSILKVLVTSAAVVALCGGAALADEIADQIKSGLDAYNAGNHSKAIEELNFAVTQITQKQNDIVGKLLPAALAGWTAEEAEGSAGGMAFLGGGSNVTKRYTKGDASIKIEIIANSPMLNAMLPLFNNPALMASDPGSKVVKIKGEKAIQKFREGSGEITTILDNTIMLKVEGNGLADAKPMEEYANALDFAAIRKAFNSGK